MPHHVPITFAEAESNLPDVCLRCGGRAVCRVNKTVRLYNTATGYGRPGVVALFRMIKDFHDYFASPTLILRGPFCERHRHHWKFRRILMWVILALIPPLLILIFAIFGTGQGKGPFLGFCTVFGGSLSAAFFSGTMTRSLGCNEKTEKLLLGFVHPRFMQALEQQRAQEASRPSSPRRKETSAAPVAELATPPPKPLPRNSADPFAHLDAGEPDGEPRPKRVRRGNPNHVGAILMIVIGAPLVMLVIVGVMVKFSVLVRGLLDRPAAERPAPNRNDKQVEEEHDVEPGTVVPKAPAMPPLPAELAGRPSIDLIPLADPRRDVIHGHWLVSNAALHCNDGSFVPRIQFPYRPPQEYDFFVTFWQPSLRNGVSLIMPNPNGGSFFWFLGNHRGKGFGFHANPGKEGRKVDLIKAKTMHTTVVQVRKGNVRALVDGNELMKLDADFRDLTCDGWRAIRNTNFLAVACDDATVFYYVRVVEVTGNGKKGR